MKTKSCSLKKAIVTYITVVCFVLGPNIVAIGAAEPGPIEGIPQVQMPCLEGAEEANQGLVDAQAELEAYMETGALEPVLPEPEDPGPVVYFMSIPVEVPKVPLPPRTITRDYDENGNLISETVEECDENGNIIKITIGDYDENGNIIKITISYYDENGNLISEVRVYDENGNLIDVIIATIPNLPAEEPEEPPDPVPQPLETEPVMPPMAPADVVPTPGPGPGRYWEDGILYDENGNLTNIKDMETPPQPPKLAQDSDGDGVPDINDLAPADPLVGEPIPIRR